MLILALNCLSYYSISSSFSIFFFLFQAHDERTDVDSLFKRYDKNTYHRPLNYRLNTNTLEDGRPYGFPFDRPAAPDVKTLAGFLTPNMRVTNTFIRFNNRRRNLEFASS